MTALRCKLEDCPQPRKNWKTPTRLGSHQWRTHGVKGKARKVGRPRGPWKNRFKMVNEVPDAPEIVEEEVPQEELPKSGSGKAIVAAILKKAATFQRDADDFRRKAEEAENKGRELEALAESVKGIIG